MHKQLRSEPCGWHMKVLRLSGLRVGAKLRGKPKPVAKPACAAIYEDIAKLN